MSDLVLALRQARWQNKAFWRNPAAAFFTFAFPLMFLVIFTSVFSDTQTLPTGVKVKSSTYYTAGILAFAVITSTYTNIANTVVAQREEGVLKRIQGTPLPRWVYLVGKMIHSVLLMALLVVIVLVFGRVFYDIDIPTTSMPAFVVALLVGAAAFCAMGLATTALTPNVEAAPAVTNAIMLPLLFLSGVFFPVDSAPGWMKFIADIFPVKHFLRATTEAFIPPPGNSAGWRLSELLWVALWGLGALLFAARRFRWDPSR
jgi:ABC-2 type transport system permease protein